MTRLPASTRTYPRSHTLCTCTEMEASVPMPCCSIRPIRSASVRWSGGDVLPCKSFKGFTCCPAAVLPQAPVIQYEFCKCLNRKDQAMCLSCFQLTLSRSGSALPRIIDHEVLINNILTVENKQKQLLSRLVSIHGRKVPGGALCPSGAASPQLSIQVVHSWMALPRA